MKEDNHLTCDACGRKTARENIRYMNLRMCCSVKRIPLCRECHERSGFIRKKKNQEGCCGERD